MTAKEISSLKCALTLAAFAIASQAAGPAYAADDLMAGYYGNTLIFWRDNNNGAETHMWINADHTFTAVNISQKDGHLNVRMNKGNWEMQGERFCRIDNTKTPPTNSCANPLNSGEPGHKVGDKWDNVTRTGEPEHFIVVAGQV